jgi:predicted permease
LIAQFRDQRAQRRGIHQADAVDARVLAQRIAINPVMVSTVLGLAWSVTGLAMPASVVAYASIFGPALTPCALFSIGLGLSFAGLRDNRATSMVLTVFKLAIMPLVVYGLCAVFGLDPFYTLAAVVCAAVPTAKTAYVLAGEYHVEEAMVASTISMTTLLSVVTLFSWLYALS